MYISIESDEAPLAQRKSRTHGDPNFAMNSKDPLAQVVGKNKWKTEFGNKCLFNVH